MKRLCLMEWSGCGTMTNMIHRLAGSALPNRVVLKWGVLLGSLVFVPKCVFCVFVYVSVFMGLDVAGLCRGDGPGFSTAEILMSHLAPSDLGVEYWYGLVFAYSAIGWAVFRKRGCCIMAKRRIDID